MPKPSDMRPVVAVARAVEAGSAYNREAVDQAIAASNRRGRKVPKKEAAAIHALLRGRAGR